MPSSITALQLFQVLRYGAMLLISIALAKSGWSTAEIGVWESLLLLSGLASFWWVGGLFNSVLPLYRKAPQTERPSLWRGTVLTAVGFTLATTLLLLLFAKPISALFGSDNILPHYQLFLLFVLINGPSYLTEYLLLMQHRTRALVIYGAVIFTLQLGVVALPPLLGYGLYETLLGLCFFAGAKLLGLFYFSRFSVAEDRQKANQAIEERTIHEPTVHEQKIQDQTGFWVKTIARLALPLMLTLLLGGISAYIDGLIVAGKLGQDKFAIFQYGAKELPIVLLLANAFSTAAAPEIADDLSKGLSLIKRRSSAMLHYFFPLSVFLMILSHLIFPLVFNEQFTDSAAIFNIYLLLLVSRMLFPQTILTGLQKTSIQLWSAAFEVSLNIGLSLALLPTFGMLGVAFATVVAHLVDKLFLMLYLHLRLGISPLRYINVPVYLIYGLILSGLCWYVTFGQGFS